MGHKGQFKVINIVGKRFGKLVVVEFLGVKKRPKGIEKRSYWKCLCDCGNFREVAVSDLQKVKCCRKCIGHPDQAARDAYGSYKATAKGRSLSFNLTFDEFLQISSQNCYYCNNVPSNTYRHRWGIQNHFIYQGIDRLNNNVGYELDNIVPCCEICNKAKRDLTIEQFNSWIYQLAVHQNLIPKSRDIW